MSVEQMFRCFEYFEANGWPEPRTRPHTTPAKVRVRPAKGELGVRRASHSRATKAGFHTGRKPGNAGRKWPAEVLTPAEVQMLMLRCSTTASTGLRNRAIFVTLYRAALRISECLDLYPHDVDAERGMIRVRHGKGDKAGTVGMDPKAFAYLAEWEERRAALGLDGSVPMFPSLHGTRLYSSYVQATLKRLAREVGIEKRVTPHGFRHTCAFEMMMAGHPLGEIQLHLRHSNIATTANYLQHLAPMAAVKAAQARGWEF